MSIQYIADKLGTPSSWSTIILLFFVYSFAGYVLECVVLTMEKKQLVVNRGFAKRMPFCIIYGFGALMGYAVLSRFSENSLLLFVFGALCASLFEYFTAWLQIRMFGDFWWDYSKKPFNYKGILCLESTLGWGIVALLVIRVLHKYLVFLIDKIPSDITAVIATLLLASYTLDFAISARKAYLTKQAKAMCANEGALTENKTEELLH